MSHTTRLQCVIFGHFTSFLSSAHTYALRRSAPWRLLTTHACRCRWPVRAVPQVQGRQYITELSPLFFTFSRFASTGAYVRRNDVVSFSWRPQIPRLVDWVLELQTFLSALILPILCQATTLVLKSQPKSHLSWPCFLVFSVSPLCIPVVILL